MTLMGTVRLHWRRSMSVSAVKMSVMGFGVYWSAYVMVAASWEGKERQSWNDGVGGEKRRLIGGGFLKERGKKCTKTTRAGAGHHFPPRTFIYMGLLELGSAQFSNVS